MSSKQPENAGDTIASVQLSNVAYGNAPKQKMDIYLPEGRSPESTRTFVLIHGGAWVSGDKSDMVTMQDSLKLRFPDYAFVNVNYRLAANGRINSFPTQENDIKAAIAYYLGRSSEFSVSRKLILFGVSAGGHLALLHAYKNDPSGNVVAVVDAFGPTDLVTAWKASGSMRYALSVITGTTYAANPKMFVQSSPISFVGKNSPPTIALQGGRDPIVDASQTYALVEKLKGAGVPHELVFYPSEAHGWIGASLTDSFNRIEAFILSHTH
jgi:acetyl esterase/lipase